jgi:N-acetylmuramoyl-L-alanine amidase
MAGFFKVVLCSAVFLRSRLPFLLLGRKHQLARMRCRLNMRFLGFFALLLALIAPMKSWAISISFNPGSTSAIIGATTTVNLRISGLVDGDSPSLSSFDLNIEFDSGLLALGGVTYGVQLDLLGLGSVIVTSPAPGNVNLFQLSLDSPSDLDSLQTGDFTLAILQFEALSIGTSPLIISVNALADSAGNLLVADTQSGEIRVLSGSVPEPSTVLLLLAFFPIFVLRHLGNFLLFARFSRRLPIVIIGIALPVSGWCQTPRTAFAFGDVFVSVSNGQVQWRDSKGILISTLTTSSRGVFTTGMAFDDASNLFVTNFNANTVSKIDRNGNALGLFSSPSSPESIARNIFGELYIGHAGSPNITLHASNGGILKNLTVAVEDRGADWIDLASDQCTMYYTSEGKEVKRFDVCSGTQLSDFTSTLPGRAAYALRVLADANTPGDPRRGGLLVADTEQIVRLDKVGNVVRTYDVSGQDCWFALNLDPDGSSFWSADFCTGTVVKFAIETGAVLLTFNAGTGSNTVFGLAVLGELTTANPILPLTVPVIAVDAGHGTNLAGQHVDRPTPSATFGLFEADMAQAIAFQTRTRLLNNALPKFQVLMTRKDKFIVPINKRYDIANRLNVNAFVSVHTNAAIGAKKINPTANGTLVLYYAPHSQAAKSLQLANAIQPLLVGLGLKDLKVQDARPPNVNETPGVLKHTRMPSVIVEVAFLTNSKLAVGQTITDEARLNSAEFRVQAGDAIGRGIEGFFP